MQSQASPKRVAFIHSAAIDDFVATAVLSRIPDIELVAILVINADCVPEPAMDVTSRVHQFLGLEDRGTPVALSTARGWNAFPWGYRSDCIRMGGIPALAQLTSKWTTCDPTAEAVLEAALRDSSEPLSILCTGPITTLTNVLAKSPDLVQRVGDVVWMGGAVHVVGNLDGGNATTTPMKIPSLIANRFAEWNVFFDPFAADETFRALQNVKLFPLDITDKAKLTTSFKNRLERQALDGSRLSALAHQAYALVSDEPFYEMWNTCATTWFATEANLFAPPTTSRLRVDTWGVETQGRIEVLDPSADANEQDVYEAFRETDVFYRYVLERLLD